MGYFDEKDESSTIREDVAKALEKGSKVFEEFIKSF